MGVGKFELSAEIAIAGDASLSLGNDVAIVVGNSHGNYRIFANHTSVKPCVHSDKGGVILNLGGSKPGAPGVDCHATARNEFYRSVQPGAGIPATTLFHVFQVHFNVTFAVIGDEGHNVYTKGIVAVGPATSFHAIDIYDGLTHSAVEE